MNHLVDLAEKIFVANKADIVPEVAFKEAKDFLKCASILYPGCEDHLFQQTDCKKCDE